MKTLNTIKGLLLAAILFGIFANFAHNNYGMSIVIISLTLLIFIFPIYSFMARRKKKKLGLKQSESPIFEGIILMLYVLGIVFKLNYFPGADLLIIVSNLLLVIYLIILSIKAIVNKHNAIREKLLSFYYFFLIMLGAMFTLFNTHHYPGRSVLFTIFVVLLVLAIFSILISIVIKGKKSILFNNFKSIFKGNMAILMVVFILLSIYTISARFNMQLKFYSDITPVAEQKLRNQIASTVDYELRMKKLNRYYNYYYARHRFFNHREKSKNN